MDERAEHYARRVIAALVGAGGYESAESIVGAMLDGLKDLTVQAHGRAGGVKGVSMRLEICGQLAERVLAATNAPALVPDPGCPYCGHTGSQVHLCPGLRTSPAATMSPEETGPTRPISRGARRDDFGDRVLHDTESANRPGEE